MGKSWNIPRFDVYDPSLVLYAPLWRPDMVARGGAIKNGTGTMNVSPQALAVGENTITVTAAGTLIVNMPEGGTVASGTMTVSGSPVTVSAGIATTITTTGAVGNITCTPSNIIRSKDRSNQATTVAGADWGLTGRTFDGLDDKITLAANAALDDMAWKTIEFWLYWVGDGISDVEIIWDKGLGATLGYGLYAYDVGDLLRFAQTTTGGNDGIWASPTNSLVKNTWQHIYVYYNRTSTANNPTMIIDGASVTVTKVTTPGGTIDSDAASVVTIGRDPGGLYPLSGILGELRLYNRTGSNAEAISNRLVTKWRYS